MPPAGKITAEQLLGAPRRSACVPNHDGKLGLYAVTEHIFGDKTTSKLRVLDLESHNTTQITQENIHGACWIPGTNDVAYLRSGDKGTTDLFVVQDAGKNNEGQLIMNFGFPLNNWKLKTLQDGSVAIVVTGLVAPDGWVFNPETTPAKSTGRIFDNIKVRSWNTLYTAERYSLWYNVLDKHNGAWKLRGPLINLIQDANLEPAGLQGSGSPEDCFAMSEHGVAFAALNLAASVDELEFSKPYYVALHSFTQAPASGALKSIAMPADVGNGNFSNMTFSPDESSIAFLYNPANESSGTRMYAASLDSLEASDVVRKIDVSFDNDTFDPMLSFRFGHDRHTILFVSEKRGREVLSTLKLHDGEKPNVIWAAGGVTDFSPVGEAWERVFLSSSNFVNSRVWQIVNVSNGTIVKTIAPADDEHADLGLSSSMVTEVDCTGDLDIPIHTFIVRPSDFDEAKKYPWLLLIHGGPVSAWSDTWGMPWNAAALAQQGYVVIQPNITGSTGYGLNHARRIRGDWLGSAVADLCKIVSQLGNVPYLDPAKGLVAGGSYGGYVVSWMLGHSISQSFCGAIWHSGIFSSSSFPLYKDCFWNDAPYGDATYPWQDPAAFSRNDPAKPEWLKRWKYAPPTLVIHPEKDYRCPITEGLATFKTLQAQGVPSRFLTFSDEGHRIRNPENLKIFYETVWDWMNRCSSAELRRRETATEDSYR